MGNVIDLNDFLKTKLSHEGYKDAEKTFRACIRKANKRLLILSTVDISALDEKAKRKAGATALYLLCLKHLCDRLLSCAKEKKPFPKDLVSKWDRLPRQLEEP